MRNWEIKSRGRFCSSCQAPFELGQVYHCLLDLSGDEPERRDFCVRCWNEHYPSLKKEAGESAYWRGVFRMLYSPVDREVIKRDLVRDLLDRYVGSTEPAHINLCYILALLEERKKIFIERETVRGEDGERMVVYEHAESGDTYLIRDPGLSLKEVEEVQAEVSELLSREKSAEEEEGGKDSVESAEGEEKNGGDGGLKAKED